MPYSSCNALHHTTELCASEAQGLATGLLLSNKSIQPTQWLAELTPDTAHTLSEQTTTLLLELFKNTRELLIQNDEFAFVLFLPDDDAPLQERLIALVSWCQGFLLGIGMNSANKNYSIDAKEIIKDIVEFTKLDTTSTEHDEDDEIALVEIVEYLRSAVLLLGEELQHP